MEFMTDPHLWATFALIVGLELVLGIDNILLISILSSRLPEEQREKARKLGLTLALVARVLLVLGASYLQKLTEPILFGLTGKAIILVGGGLFLTYKAVKEMHFVVEKYGIVEESHLGSVSVKFGSVLLQILLMDMVFSIDSVITAVGLTDSVAIIEASVVVSFVLVLFFSKSIAQFVIARPTLKILALSFLVCIGVTLFVEGFGAHVPKAYIYLPMGFALGVELLQLRYDEKRKRLRS